MADVDTGAAQTQPATASILAAEARVGQPRRRRSGRPGSLRANWTTAAGLAIVTLYVVLAVLAPVIATHDPTQVDATNMLAGRSHDNWLGTDNLGRDIFSRLVFGARWSLGASIGATAVIVAIGVTVGLVAGYFGGLLDAVLMRIVDVLLAFPSLVIALAIVGMLGPSLINVMLGMIAVWWVDYSRIIRGLTMSLRRREYIEAAHCIGCSNTHVITRHLLPNVVPSVAVLATLELGGLMLALSGLSFLGLGAQPPTPEWGAMLNAGRPFFFNAPQLMIYPGLAITIAVIGFNLVGDGLRDALDPHTRRR